MGDGGNNDGEKIDEEEEDKIKTVAFEIDVSSSSLGDGGLKSVLDAVESKRDDGSSSPTVRRMDVRARADLLTAEGATALFDRLSAWGEVEAAGYRCTDDGDASVVTGGNGTTGGDLGSGNLVGEGANATLVEADAADGGEDGNNVATDGLVANDDTLPEANDTDDGDDGSEAAVAPLPPPPPSPSPPLVHVSALDLGLNDLGSHGKEYADDAD